jgi:hypothetical protein
MYAIKGIGNRFVVGDLVANGWKDFFYDRHALDFVSLLKFSDREHANRFIFDNERFLDGTIVELIPEEWMRFSSFWESEIVRDRIRLIVSEAKIAI